MNVYIKTVKQDEKEYFKGDFGCSICFGCRV